MEERPTEERVLEDLIDHLPIPVFVQAQEQFAYANPPLLKLLGLTRRDRLIGTSVVERVAPQDRQASADRIRRVNQERVAVGRADISMVRKDGVEIPVTISSIPYTFRGQAGSLVFPQDRSGDQGFKDLVERLPLGVFLGHEGAFVYANAEACRILGAAPARLLGTRILDRIPERRKLQVLSFFSQLRDRSEPSSPVDQEFLRFDGSEVPVETSAIPFPVDGKVGALVFLRDMTADRNFRTMIDHLPAGVFIQTGGRFALINGEARRILGVTDEAQLLGTPVVERFVEAERNQVAERIRRLNQDRTVISVAEETMLRGDGSTVSVQVSAIPYRYLDEDGALVYVRDLTQEKEAHKILLLKDELLRLTGSMAMVGGWEFDAQTFEGTWTDEVARIHDLDPLVPTNVSLGLSYYTETSRKAVEAAIDRAIRQAEPYDLVLELHTAQGRKKWVRSHGSPVVEGGRVVRVQGIFQDITAPYQAARALEEESERLNLTLRSIGDGVITTDAEGRVALMSRAAEDLTGWPLAEAVGRPLAEVMPLVSGTDGRAIESPVALVAASGEGLVLPEFTAMLTRDGRQRLVSTTAAPLRDRANTFLGVVLVFRDMTERQRLAEAVQRAQNLEAIGLLASGIAHDFNNLLSGLFGQVQLAAEKVKRGRADEALVNLDRALGVFDRAKDLTGQLLTFAKGGEPVRTHFDLRALAVKTTQFALSGSQVKSRFQVDPDLGQCFGDPHQIAQVIENLVINARQALAGAGTLEVDLRNGQGDEAAFLVLEVTDNGPGLAPGVIERIFDPFFTTKAGGHGIGLAAVQSIVQRHGGAVEAASAPGRGARFRVTLPRG